MLAACSRIGARPRNAHSAWQYLRSNQYAVRFVRDDR